MANPSKKKGTAGETEVKGILEHYGVFVRRTPACTEWDLERDAPSDGPYILPIDALATRPDKGEWLVTLRLQDYAELVRDDPAPLRIEVKRYARFALHTIFGKKFA